ncbi:MAG: glycosyltransferase family 2 protein [Galactobacillus timonensis]|uniref:glycosyltransferase family 2 protein n=1 Tax=Galactobacillus timonensis TaxID=2041840 RepID=UPI0023F1B657|nr:glycosyltransferase family 2 protein [Galactobacillus timonensis]MDY5223053.1 glycosyltransferase family 2 protein [Lachnospiraceae bacterium]MCI6753755.1 glycosyltransferase family 2 protein [Galactobacillus timonensis]MDD5850646.1 glycosyltransferase family 2 protein [Galactobacillus timonensis]MDD6370413.1 glycosyltransferase family 2 protein [Galactobacillus timonensis]MDD6600327.1 glycosyltransferase family 2 protein [Galactobacillus timonensis]
MLLSVVVPCYNEEKSVPLFYTAAVDVLKTLPLSYELIFVNDGSRDGTLQEMLKLYEAHRDTVRVIDFSRNFGKEAGLLAGLRASKGDLVTVMDVDLQDPPSLLPKMLETMEKNGDDIVGTRRVDRKGEPPVRSWFARKFYKLINRYTEVEIVDGARDFRLMKRPVVDAILSLKERNRFSKGLFVWVGFKSEYLEYENVERAAGESKWSFWKLFRYALDGIIEYTDAPLRAAAWVGGVLSAVMGIELIVLLILSIVGSVSSSVVLISVVLFLGGIILLAAGIIGEYLAKTYDEVRQRPPYIVKHEYRD